MKKRRHFILSVYGCNYWFPILAAGGVLLITLGIIATHDTTAAPYAWTAYMAVAVLTLAGLAFFRDFPREIPDDVGIMVAPADGKVTEITHLQSYEPLGASTVRVGIFLSVLDVHVNRAPCDGMVVSTQFKEGLFLDARHPESGLKNQSFTVVLADSETQRPVAVVRQVVGAIARRILSPVQVGDVWRRGERFGMIAFGSRTELYVPAELWEPAVKVGEHVKGGMTIVVRRR